MTEQEVIRLIADIGPAGVEAVGDILQYFYIKMAIDYALGIAIFVGAVFLARKLLKDD